MVVARKKMQFAKTFISDFKRYIQKDNSAFPKNKHLYDISDREGN